MVYLNKQGDFILQWFLIAPEHRKKGIGSTFLNYLKDSPPLTIVRAKNVLVLYDEADEKICSYYENNGFHKAYQPNGERHKGCLTLLPDVRVSHVFMML